MRVSAMIGLLLLGTSTAAVAADLSMPPPQAQPLVPAPPSWTGLYFGIAGGGALGTSNQIANGPLGFGPVTSGYDARGALVGGTVGYNWALSNQVIFGVEGDMSWTDIQGSAHEAPPFTTSSVVDTKEKWLATERGRIGWAATNNVMLYATGGVAEAAVQADITPAAASIRSDTETRWGGAVGGGLETRIAPNWSLKAEYLYTKFQSKDYFSNPPPGTNTRSNVPLDNNVIRVGVNYSLQ